MRRLLALCVCLLPACGGSPAWTPLPGKATPAQEKQQKRAAEARDQLFQELLGKLTQTLQADGPAGAISVCKELAPTLAETVSRRLSVRIGRTSDKLRNAANTAPAWAVQPLLQKPKEPVYLAGPAGELGALLPIRVLAPCLACHGPATAIEPKVKEQIGRLYPDDQATGYAQNDLRGWFWVEVPRQ